LTTLNPEEGRVMFWIEIDKICHSLEHWDKMEDKKLMFEIQPYKNYARFRMCREKFRNFDHIDCKIIAFEVRKEKKY